VGFSLVPSVDVDFALSGIDKLLRSQELTFGFVSVAPALAITYAFFGWIRGFWPGGRGRGAYGRPKEREKVWLAMRRVERLLVVDSISEGGRDRPKANGSARPDGSKGALSPTTQGLLLLYLTHLREFAEKYLKERFSEDIEDLEDTRLAGEEKRMVVRRMWESWGDELGWRILDIGKTVNDHIQPNCSSRCVLALLIAISGGDSRYGCTLDLDFLFSWGRELASSMGADIPTMVEPPTLERFEHTRSSGDRYRELT